MMKKLFVCLLPTLALLFLSGVAGRADQFDAIVGSPATYWVPAPTPGYASQGGPAPYGYGSYGAPPPGYGYYGPPPGPRVVIVPRFFFGFHFH